MAINLIALRMVAEAKKQTWNALEKADQLVHSSHQWGFNWPLISESAEMLRSQHEAIVKLQEALGTLLVVAESFSGELHTDHYAVIDAKQAMKDTEDLK